MASVVAQAYNGGLGAVSPAGSKGRAPGQEVWGGKAPQKLNTTIHFISQFSPNFGVILVKFKVSANCWKLGLHVPWQFLIFLCKHKRRCFDNLMCVCSIGFTLRESTRYTIYGIMSITLQRYL